MKIAEIYKLLATKIPKVKGIVNLLSGKVYLLGESPFYDMQIENMILCPENIKNWHGFNPNDYKLIYN